MLFISSLSGAQVKFHFKRKPKFLRKDTLSCVRNQGSKLGHIAKTVSISTFSALQQLLEFTNMTLTKDKDKSKDQNQSETSLHGQFTVKNQEQ